MKIGIFEDLKGFLQEFIKRKGGNETDLKKFKEVFFENLKVKNGRFWIVKAGAF